MREKCHAAIIVGLPALKFYIVRAVISLRVTFEGIFEEVVHRIF